MGEEGGGGERGFVTLVEVHTVEAFGKVCDAGHGGICDVAKEDANV